MARRDLPLVSNETLEAILDEFESMDKAEFVKKYYLEMHEQNPELARYLGAIIHSEDPDNVYLFIAGAVLVYEVLRREKNQHAMGEAKLLS